MKNQLIHPERDSNPPVPISSPSDQPFTRIDLMSWLAWSNSSELMVSLGVPGSHLGLSNCARVARSTQEKDYRASLNWPIIVPPTPIDLLVLLSLS